MNAGEHTITASGAAVQGNYNVVFVNGTLTISKKAATVIVDDKTKIYGDADPALTAVVNGTVGKDTINYTLERAAGADVGVYAITAKLGSNPNYNVTVKNGELTITPATAYILPTGELNGSFVKNYGEEDPALTAIAFDSRDKDKKDITGTIQYTITREPGKDVGDYKLIFNFEEEQGNYIVVELTKAFYLGIKPAELTVEVNDASKVYGEADPAFTAKVTGLVNGETEADATIVYSRTEEAEGKEDVGTYAGAITAALLNEEGNYVITEVINGDLVIKPMDVTVTVSDAAMVYGGDAPVPMAAVKDAKGNAVTGLDISFKAYKVENGAVSDQEIAIADLANADAGSYVIKAVLDNSNYNVVSYKNGELTIAPKTIYIDINDEPITIIEGEAMPEDIAYTLSDENGAITGDALAALIEDIKPVFSALDGDEAIKVEEAKTGEYVITADTANGNYMLVVSTEGVLVIEEDFTGVQFDKVSLSLNLESEVHINLDFTLKGLSKDVAPESILDRLSLLIWNDGNQPATDAESTMAAKPDTITTRASYNKETGMYRIRTDGIAAKNMADILYMKLCIDQLNNNYVYSMRYKFSPKIYCDYVMTSNSYGKDLKDLCAALMNYGAAAQEYFHKKNGYQYAKLMNADSIYANYTIEDYAASMIDALAGLDSSKHGEFVYNGKFTSWRHYLSLEGAITLNFELLHKGEASDAGIYVWNESTYLNAKTLTKENATKIAGKNASEGFFVGAFAGNAAKQIGDTVYVCAYAVIDGVTYYSGVFQDSIEQFAAQIATGEEFDAEFKHVSEDLVVYGEYARRYFKYA